MAQRLLFVVGVLLSWSTCTHAEHRVALLIANSNYQGANLASPSNDVGAVEKALQQHGFRTLVTKNLDRKNLRATIERFAESAPTRGTALFYFGGYALPGIRRGNETDNFFVSVDARIRSDRDIGNGGYGIRELMEFCEKRCGATNTIILVDGCYQHPQQPQAQLTPPKEFIDNAFVGYATKPGSVITPVKSGLSPFAAALIKNWNNKSLNLVTGLRAASGWHSSSLPQVTSLTGPASKAIAPPSKFTVGNKAGEEWVNGRGMVFCWCPPGTYTMGSPTTESGRMPDEKQVRVTFQDGFWISKYEITIRENLRNRPRGKLLGKTKNHPITLIHLDDGRRMAKKTLTEIERKAGRLPNDWEYDLPTEQEWEYAARAGTTTPYYFGSDVQDLSKHANLADKSFYDTGDIFSEHAVRTLNDGTPFISIVGSYKPNPWGLHDVYGNVAEWCIGGPMRGGSFLSLPSYCRSAQRNVWPNRSEQNFLGYRFVIRKKSRATNNRKQ
ncbi:MAG: SUMF1/EgtB/PvdO family nonheme iron enzyme [Gemmataceae bacterium]